MVNNLLQYELINKYKLKTSYGYPQINKIICQLSFKNILEACDSVTSNFDNTENIKIKSVLFFYLLFFDVPLVNFYTPKTLKRSKSNKVEGDFIIKFVLTEKDMIRRFKDKLSLYNNNYINYKLSFLKILNLDKRKNINFNTKISG